jgi:hypothetical protein
MGDSGLTENERYIASNMLQEAFDKRVLPILIRHVDDRRVFALDAELAGETMEPTHETTVGMQSEAIIRHLIAGGRAVEYDVSDWQRWWAENEGKSLNEIIQMVRSTSRPYRPKKGN